MIPCLRYSLPEPHDTPIMRLFLIRHAETVDNVAHILAGTTDSALTNHGASQIECLDQHFKSQRINFTRIFASDLSRAALTAQGICRHQQNDCPIAPVHSALIRERDFGSFEGKKWSASSQSQPMPVMPEPDDSIRLRANSFINDHLLPLVLDGDSSREVVAVVSHGITLQFLWKCLAALFHPGSIRVAPDAGDHHADYRFMSPTWTNTGFLELHVQAVNSDQQAAVPILGQDDLSYPLLGWGLEVKAINSRTHLAQLRRIQGGIGSARFDQNQQRLDRFFRR